jgi:ADP-ribose pyrophosphatase YjhB (NUDIX family)
MRSDTCVNFPRTGKEHDFYVLDSVNWVNVIAVTPDQQLVMVEQYRHGSNTVELEIPGGMMDAGETDPVATAVRELREETGYAGENARLLGKIHSNPAILSNVTYTVLIENCRLQHGVEFDSGEDLITRSCPSRKSRNSSPTKKSATPSSSSRCIILICGSGELKNPKFTGSMSTASVTSSGSASDWTMRASSRLNALIARVRSMIW